MKILIITQKINKNDPILGFFHDWVLKFSEVFEGVYVICLEKGEYSLPENVKIFSLGKEVGESRLKYLWNFYKYTLPLIFGKRVDKVLVHMVEMYALLLVPLVPVMTLKNIKFLWWKAHGHLSKKSRFVLNFVDILVTSSDEGFPLKTNKKKVVGQGIDTNKFNMRMSQNENTIDNFQILFAGRISPVKHIEDLLYSLPILKREIHKNIVVNIVGNVPEKKQDYFEKLQKISEQIEFGGEVNFLGSVNPSKIAKLYQEHDVLVNPSDTDSMDKVVLEAMACGVIPIASNLAYEEILRPYDLYLPKRDTKKLAEIIERIYSMPQDEKSKLKNELRAIVVENHNLENLAKKIYKI